DDGFVQVGRVYRGRFGSDDSGQPGEFEYANDRPSGWKTADERLMFGAWGHLWAGRYVRIANVDVPQRRIRTADRATYGFRQGQPYYYLNILEELDQPGEWYWDRRRGIVYLYLPPLTELTNVEFPRLSAPLVMMNNVRHVTLRGLTFELGRTDGVVILGGEKNLLAGCTVRRMGGNGVIVQGGEGHGVLGCDLETLGAGGVRMDGGDRKTLRPGGHFVENCHIHDFSRVDRVYAPAVHLDGVGNRIAHNLMHDSPHHALRVEGWDHVIEFNEVHSVVYEYDDQAGIDIYGHPAYRGLVIRYNYWHHIGSGHDVAGQAGIRLDDYISAVRMIGNVFYRSSGGKFGGIQIHGGKDNIADNNLFIDCKSAFSFSAWGQQRWEQRLAEPGALRQLARDGVDRDDSPHRSRYPDLADLASHADRNFLLRNLAIDCGQFRVRDRGVNELLDNHQMFGDPGFADRQRDDFSLPADLPLYDRCGFRPIPLADIGLYADALRASWPVKHQVSPHFVREE
ncbi:MAG: right-handed parallel beta-helix repeat-containing protein, partial [Planctomycetes bacterium]|nr:right-handed parallel beta-helix repeat-containing protein [Planctomycetota bacterium]